MNLLIDTYTDTTDTIFWLLDAESLNWCSYETCTLSLPLEDSDIMANTDIRPIDNYTFLK